MKAFGATSVAAKTSEKDSLAGRDPFFQFMFAIRNARKRAGKRGMAYEITEQDARALWERCGGRCELTQIEFDFSPVAGNFARRPFAPSIDRIDNGLGYTIPNVRVVCIAVNLAMNTWGEDVLMRVATGLLQNGRVYGYVCKSQHPDALPHDVRLAIGKRRRMRYMARVRDAGIEAHLGTFDTVEQAINARTTWARQNKSSRVMRQVFEFTNDPALLLEIKAMQQADGG